MPIEIRQVESRRDLRAFVNFPETLYKDNEFYVPPLVFDQMDTLDQKKGAAQEFCKSALYMAYKDGKPVGRVAAIVNFKANEQWNHKEVRFGWLDFVDDPEVSGALMEKVYEFGRQYGMESVVGPLGFTDFDPEGILIAGYDRLNTMALIYNYPYYNDHMERMGFEKDTDWVEYKLFMKERLPERLERIAKIVQQRTNVHVKPLTRKIIRKEDYGTKVFKLVNECYKDLYNFTVLPDHMAKKYLDFYLSILDLRYLIMLENDKDELVAFGITMPSIARALQKSRGKLFPFGWWHLLKSMFLKHEEGVEMLLIGVRPDYQNTGINSLLFYYLFPFFQKQGVQWAETNAVLETNVKNQGQMEQFAHECVKRRRSYIKKLEY
ncbi:MAG: N-acetyltransferase [Bacteroidales bacterium]|nr:N-acetyltransferase [Bacteroidales bacterium]